MQPRANNWEPTRRKYRSRRAQFGLFGVVLAGSLAVGACTESSPQVAPFERISPEGLADSQKLWNYSQAITIGPDTRLVEIAGTTGDDSDGNIVNAADFAAQVERAFANLETSLKAAGASGTDVVRVRLYVVGLDGEKHWPALNAAMRRHFGDQGPTSTLIGVQALAAPDILFEMDATAVISRGRSRTTA